jgi:hypothetical protein
VDEVSLNFQGQCGGRVLAAVRLTRANDALADLQMAQLLRALKLRRLSNVVVNSRFVVQPALRARRLIVPMLREVYRAGLVAGARFCYLASKPKLAGTYERFGFKFAGATFDDPIAGQMQVLRLDLHDVENLISTASPLLPVFIGRFNRPRASAGLRETYFISRG